MTMKKLNNKGMSLIELIISFSLVCVAIVYFFETLFITNKIFRTTKSDTKNYVDVAYVFNILDYYVHNDNDFKDAIKTNNLVKAKSRLDTFINNYKDEEFAATTASEGLNSQFIKSNLVINPSSPEISDRIYCYIFFINGKEHYYYIAKTE